MHRTYIKIVKNRELHLRTNDDMMMITMTVMMIIIIIIINVTKNLKTQQIQTI
jgi:hypothetical protein